MLLTSGAWICGCLIQSKSPLESRIAKKPERLLCCRHFFIPPRLAGFPLRLIVTIIHHTKECLNRQTSFWTSSISAAMPSATIQLANTPASDQHAAIAALPKYFDFLIESPQVASDAGRAGSAGQASLRQALALAKRYKIDEWPLQFAYLQALILQASGDFASLEPSASSASDRLKLRPEVRPDESCFRSAKMFKGS